MILLQGHITLRSEVRLPRLSIRQLLVSNEGLSLIFAVAE
jgi:hypothetical protein